MVGEGHEGADRHVFAAVELSYLERLVLRIIADVYGRTRQPVRTIAVQARLGKGDRNCRRYLTAMERRGLVLRVGLRGGWLPVEQVDPARVAVAYVEMREYAAQLEAQLEALLWALGARADWLPVRPATGRRADDALIELMEQPPLPCFAGLVPVAYLN